MAITSLFAVPGFTSQFLVYNRNDTGAGSLRQALLDNNSLGGTNTVTFSNVVSGTLLMSNDEFLVTGNVAILGPGPAILAINGNIARRVFHLTNAATVLVSGLTITNSPAPYAGAIYNDHSTLILSNCVLSGNQAGAIYNDGSVGTVAAAYIVSSTISSNTVNGNGAGIQSFGYQGTAWVAIVSSTLSGNATVGANTAGGAILNNGNDGSAALSVSNSTFSGNSSFEGGAIFTSGASGMGPTTVDLFSTTFCSNSASAAGGAIFNNGVAGTSIVTLGNTILKTGPRRTT